MQWREADRLPLNESLPELSENLPSVSSFSRKDWIALNRARARVGKTGDNLAKWGLIEGTACSCGEQIQTMDHILRRYTLGPSCSNQDLLEANHAALRWIQW